MISFDPRVLAVTGSISSAVLALVLFLLRRGFPRDIRGLGNWSWGALAGFAGGLLLAARGQVPDLVSIVLGNALVAGGYVLFHRGTLRFYGMRWRGRAWLSALACYVLANVWFTTSSPDPDARLVLFALFVSTVNGAHARVAIKRGSATLGGRMLALILVADVALLLGRAAWTFAGRGGPLFDPTLLQAIYLGTFIAFSALLTISLVVLSTERLKQDLEYLSTHDFLTGALSRRALFDFGERLVASCARYDRPVAVALLDLDRFKRINDRYGHQTGDRVLVDFTRRCQAQLRKSDILARYGGEEFVAVLPEAGAVEALAVAERIRAAVEAAGEVPAYTVSIGVAVRTDDRPALQALISAADAALYRAKSEGRNRVELAG